MLNKKICEWNPNKKIKIIKQFKSFPTFIWSIQWSPNFQSAIHTLRFHFHLHLASFEYLQLPKLTKTVLLNQPFPYQSRNVVDSILGCYFFVAKVNEKDLRLEDFSISTWNKDGYIPHCNLSVQLSLNQFHWIKLKRLSIFV